jgi:TatD DNase family protein
MMRSPKHRKLIATLPLERLLTETDDPFVQRDGNPIWPRQLVLAVEEIAALHRLAPDQPAKVILQNLKCLVMPS